MNLKYNFKIEEGLKWENFFYYFSYY
jgi:hypothetical protein